MSPPDVAFRGQPLNPSDATGERLLELLADPAFDEVTFVVAWARFRGLWRLKSELEAFAARGVSTIILGVDEGGASRPGLLLALELFTHAFVFHDERPGTFHPKVYLATGPERATLLVGSSNATAGGLFLNVEASLEATFTLPSERDHPALRDAVSYIASLNAEDLACSALTLDLVDELVRNPRYLVSGTERRRRSPEPPELGGTDPAEIDEEPPPGGLDRLFGSASYRPGSIPALGPEANARLAELELEDGTSGEAGSEAVESSPGRTTQATARSGAILPFAVAAAGQPTIVESWSKVLPTGDAQQPGNSSRTNLTGLLRLSKAGHPIDWRTYFRRTLFGPASWRPAIDSKRNPIETATVTFAVRIAGVALGQTSLRIDHAPHREAGQSNVPTILHWGTELGPLLRATPYQGHTVTLARLSNGTYELTIS